VAHITGASFWAKGNNAIDIVYDEGDNNAHGGGRVAEIVVTSHGPRHVTAPAFYSHYSLLRTIQNNFGLGCLQHSCDATTHPLTPLFAVTGSPAAAFHPLAEPRIAALSPTPTERVHYTASTSSGAGWTVQRAPALGTNDNSLGAVAAVSRRDVWAIGNFLPDTTTSNQDATLAKAVHFDGTRWTETPVPDSGPNFNTPFGVAAVPGQAWAVGVSLDRSYHAHSLIEAWDGSAWHIAATPRLGSLRDILFSAAATSPHDVWAVGEQQGRDGRFGALIEHWDGTSWSVVPSPDPGHAGNQLFGVTAAGPDNVWAVGQRNDPSSDTPLVEHWDGHAWTVVDTASTRATGLLQGVAVRGHEVWAVGQTDDATHQARPLVLHLDHGSWTAQLPAGVGSGFSNVSGVTVAGHTVWLVGSALNQASGNQLTVVARNDGAGWQRVAAPNPGSGDRIFGGVAAVDGTAWAVGAYDTSAGRAPLIEVHRPS